MNWLASEGGHILVSMTLVAGGMMALHNGVEYGREITIYGIATLARSMGVTPNAALAAIAAIGKQQGKEDQQ